MRIRHPLTAYIVIDEEGETETFFSADKAWNYRVWLSEHHRPPLDSTVRKYQLTVSRKERKERG